MLTTIVNFASLKCELTWFRSNSESISPILAFYVIINRRDLIALKSSVLSNLFAFELLLLFLFVFFDRGTVVQFSEMTVAFPSIRLHILAVSLTCGPGTPAVSLRIAGLIFFVNSEFLF